MLQYLRKLSGGKSGRTAVDQVTDRRNQTAVLGKADVLMVPDPVTVEPGCAAQGVPHAVMGIASEVSDLLQEEAHADQCVSKNMSQVGEQPAAAAVEQFFQPFGRRRRRRHNRRL